MSRAEPKEYHEQGRAKRNTMSRAEPKEYHEQDRAKGIP